MVPAPGTAPARTLTIAILDDYLGIAEQHFPTHLFEQYCQATVRCYTDHAGDADALLERVGPAEVVIAMRERSRFPAEVLERMRATELLITTGPRNAAIDLDAARAGGITVCATRGKDSAPAELTWALVMAVVRGVPAEDAGIRAGRWGVHLGETLRGKTLGILGFGRIGRTVAGFGRAFGMQVLAHSRNLTLADGSLAGVEAVDRDTLFRESDIVSVHLTPNAETLGSIGRRELGLMKSSAYFVNTARGPIVDEAALVDALGRGALRGAALDVFEIEPLPADSPLRSLPNVVLTPHIGYVTDERYRDYYGQAAEIVRDYLAGRPTRQIG